jgi:hypothetical protein
MARKTKIQEGENLDRRIERRHAVERPCRVTLAPLAPQGLDGITMNISRAGVLVRFPGVAISSRLPKVGSDARVVIDLPPSANYPPRVLECTGRVVRDLTAQDSSAALAFEIRTMEISDGGSIPPPKSRARKKLLQ